MIFFCVAISCSNGDDIKSENPITCSGFDCSDIFDDKLATGVALPEAYVQLNLGNPDKDIHSMLFHFDPTTTVPKDILLTNCGTQSQTFRLEDKSISFLILDQPWSTNCLNVTFGPEMFVHNLNNDVVVIQAIYLVGHPC
eukprot:TCALIF_04542-PA protein Name:"Protein of unknown function" AED:0.15 eAED:0.15 QI:0/1/0/1/1/1/2/0/139